MEDRISAEEVQIAFNKLETSLNQKFAAEKEETLTLLRNVQKTLTDGIALNNNDIMNINSLLAKKQEKFDSNLVEEIAKKTRKQVEECRQTVDTLYTEMVAKLNIAEYESDLLEVKNLTTPGIAGNNTNIPIVIAENKTIQPLYLLVSDALFSLMIPSDL